MHRYLHFFQSTGLYTNTRIIPLNGTTELFHKGNYNIFKKYLSRCKGVIITKLAYLLPDLNQAFSVLCKLFYFIIDGFQLQFDFS